MCWFKIIRFDGINIILFWIILFYVYFIDIKNLVSRLLDFYIKLFFFESDYFMNILEFLLVMFIMINI